ncbi:M3 family metallopeptidase [Dyella tabacisoli]|nr:M3 family metallopeptidase [Dyella tabacisoli]
MSMFPAISKAELPAGVGASAATHHIDQTAYFESSAVEQAQREHLLADMAAFAAQSSADAQALLNYLHHAESLLVACRRHSAYLHLRSAMDIEDRVTADALDQVDNAAGRLATATRTTLRGLGTAGFAKVVAAEPALGRYAYLQQQAVRGLPHELPEAQQTILDEVADPATTAFWTLYQQTRRSTDFGKVRMADAEWDVDKDAKALAINPDRAVRRDAWQRRWDGYAGRADIYAGILLSVVRMNDRTARLQHYKDAPSAAYFERQLSREAVNDTLMAVAAQAKVMQAYQRLRAANVTAMTGISEVRSWDLALPAPGFAAPQFTFEQIRVTALQALTPLGQDYVAGFGALLDPSQGRMDLVAEQGKRVDDGFSISAPGVATGLFVGRYSGDLAGARVVIHEGGHAMHAQLMNEQGVSPFYEHGPSWMSETIAILNELLLYDHLHRSASDPRAKAYYLQALLDDMTFQIFTSAEESDLEQSIYDGVVAGKLKNASDLDALTLATMSKYEIWPAYEPQLAHTWMTKRLMYQDPLYLVNYLYAGLLATKMFAMAQHDPADFQRRYMALLRNGFNAPPEDMLRTFFGRDVLPREWVADDMAVLKQKIQVLERIYKQIEPGANAQTRITTPDTPARHQ